MPPKKINKNCISIIWDFDGTLTSQDSTTDLIQKLTHNTNMKKFWKSVKKISRVKPKTAVNSISTSETPAWMYMLSEIANAHSFPLDIEFNKFYMIAFAKHIKLYSNVLKLLKKIKSFSRNAIYKKIILKYIILLLLLGYKI